MAISDLTGYFYRIIHSINGVLLVLIAGIRALTVVGKRTEHAPKSTRTYEII
jgi:hypothetical protein